MADAPARRHQVCDITVPAPYLRIDYTVFSLYAFSLAIACIYFRLARLLPPRFENEVDRPRFELFSLLAGSFLPTSMLASSSIGA